MDRQESRLVVGAGSYDGRIYVVDGGDGRELRVSPHPHEARAFADAEEAQRLVDFLKAHPNGREPHWTVFALSGAEEGQGAVAQDGQVTQDNRGYTSPGSGDLAGADALGDTHKDIGRGGD